MRGPGRARGPPRGRACAAALRRFKRWRKLEQADKRDDYHRIERAYGAFSRSFTLPPTVDAEHISAESKDGVLRIRLPKRAETKPRRIEVQVESARLTGQPTMQKQ